MLGIILFSFYYQYFYIYDDIKLGINDYTKLKITDYVKFNTTEYKKLDTTTSYSKNIETEIENFNDELFCPIINLEKNQEEYKLLSDIKYLQFRNGECNFNDPNEKFFIIENVCDWGGLFASLWCLSLYFSDSLLLNRKISYYNEMEIY